MAGTRPLTSEEISQVLKHLDTIRDKTMFILGIKTGFRIQELLSIKVDDVMKHGTIVDVVRVKRRFTKGKVISRDVALSQSAKDAIKNLIDSENLKPSNYLFKSRKGDNKPIERGQAWTILDNAYRKARLQGSLGCHSMRKTFAKNVYQALSFDLVKTKIALGHRSINSTISYLPVSEEEVQQVVKSIE